MGEAGDHDQTVRIKQLVDSFVEDVAKAELRTNKQFCEIKDDQDKLQCKIQLAETKQAIIETNQTNQLKTLDGMKQDFNSHVSTIYDYISDKDKELKKDFESQMGKMTESWQKKFDDQEKAHNRKVAFWVAVTGILVGAIATIAAALIALAVK